MTNKTLNNTNPDELKANVPDAQVYGDPDTWVCICKAWSKEQGWMKSTKALQLGEGILVQVSTQQGNNIAEALTYVPGAIIRERQDGTYEIW